MRSNLLNLIGILLILGCVILLGYWKFAVGLTGLAFLIAAYFALDVGNTDGA